MKPLKKQIPRIYYYAAIGSYIVWGTAAVYWKELEHLPAIDIFLHRTLWSSVFLVIWVTYNRGWKDLKRQLTLRQLGLHIATAALIGANMYLFIYGATNNLLVQVSLGYFMNPLVSAGIGVLLLKENLSPTKQISLGLAGLGILVSILLYGAIQWLALAIAISFPAYGLLKKYSVLTASSSVFVESALVTLFLLITESGNLIPRALDQADIYFLLGSGVVTLLPLAMFSLASKRLPLSTLGMLQYLAPSIQLGCGILIYGEALSASQMIVFPFVWAGLILFVLGSFTKYKNFSYAEH